MLNKYGWRNFIQQEITRKVKNGRDTHISALVQWYRYPPCVFVYHLFQINIPGGKREPSQFAKFSLRLLDKVTSTVSKKLTENKTIICCLLSRHFCHFYYSCVADETGYLASVFIVSLPGIHLSLQQQLYWLYLRHEDFSTRTVNTMTNVACVQTSPLPQKKSGEETSVK